MRVLVLSDIHANHTALKAVIKDAGMVDETWCLGDLVGYGPNPNEVVEEMRGMEKLTCVLGNHDMAAIERMPLSSFNGDARHSLLQQQAMLSKDNLEFMKSLGAAPLVKGQVTLVHGSPRDPVWEYIVNSLTARLNFEHFETAWCFVGHTHIQCRFSLAAMDAKLQPDLTKPDLKVRLQTKQILNPGSVGQPRDLDPRAAYAIYDTEEGTWLPRRVNYDITEVQRRIRAAGLPEKHAARLSEGW